ncbi:hypothetical protein [Acidipila sp. EB88]|uniref:hypothetical protein n=1 Tax=Acidipila sp. EB88 TaxID=2305226 RepID=UPI000F5DB63F|nr:hypothetical protein [Acidipila sp. EB88]RRA49298.1 hypothetical protein D1Y84_14460 [Acidipila sp. EB88]
MARGRDIAEERSVLRRLKDLPAREAEAAVRRALEDRSASIVERAAEVAAHHDLKQLTPVVVEAFERLLAAGKESDPQCAGKLALARALAAFEYQDPAPFLAGIRHVQLEGWYPLTDTAAGLRGCCALALVQTELNDFEVLKHMVQLLQDREPVVRTAAAQAIAKVGTEASSLLLRLRAQSGSREPEVVGACYEGVLKIEGTSALEWVQQFMQVEDELGMEAAMAISATHTVEGFRMLKERYKFQKLSESEEHSESLEDPWFRKGLLSAIALTRRQEATTWLFELVEQSPREAALAQAALCLSAPSADTLARLEQLGRPCSR